MSCNCADCIMFEGPDKETLKRAGLDAAPYGYCVDIEAFVLLEDTALDQRCRDLPEDRL